MENPDEIISRLTELEIKASYADDLMDQLNKIVFQQQQTIDLLLREVAVLRRQLPEGGASTPRSARDDLPPHY